MPHNQYNITIKGTKDGLVFILDDSCSFDDLLTELKEKLSSDYHRFSSGPLMAVKLQTGNRYLTEPQKKQIRDIILKEKNLLVEDFESNVVTKEQAAKMAKQKQVTSVTQIVRSGQQLEVTGDLLLVGDVNSGASVKATGNIFVMGMLRGAAHAGCEGNTDAVIAAAVMKPSQLRISEVIRLGSDVEPTGDQAECAFIGGDHEGIIVDRIQRLYHKPVSKS
ncbi:MAG TPA: septum site-determining protein MinC [Bacillales bacterium]|nr:septum site-determining protein MinC [Bacillales bacterium]